MAEQQWPAVVDPAAPGRAVCAPGTIPLSQYALPGAVPKSAPATQSLMQQQAPTYAQPGMHPQVGDAWVGDGPEPPSYEQLLHKEFERRSEVSGGVGCLSAFAKNHHSSATLATVFFLVSVVPVGYYFWDNWPSWVLIIPPVVFLIYWIEVGKSDTMAYLWNVYLDDGTEGYIKKMRNSPPVLTFHIQCYHMEERTRRRNNRTVIVEERVDTHQASEEYEVKLWGDGSAPLDTAKLRQFTMTRCDFDAYHCFANKVAKERFKNKKNLFKAENSRDKFFDFSVDFRIKGFEDHILSCRTEVDLDGDGKANLPMGVGMWSFALASCCFFTTCYRCWFYGKTGEVKYTFVKQLVN